MNCLFAFHTTWPVLRTKVGSDGTAEVMRMTPPLNGPFDQAIVDMAAPGSAWRNSTESRAHLRSYVRCRARLRATQGDAEGERVNIETLSQGGCLVIGSNVPRSGSMLSLEIRDLPGGTVELDARVAWSRSWDDSVKIPNCGLEIVGTSTPDIVTETLRNSEFFTELS